MQAITKKRIPIHRFSGEEQRPEANQPPAHSNTLAVISVLLFGLLVCFLYVDDYSIRDWDEATHILAVQNMFQNGHWFTPIVEGKEYFNKPPFKMWLSAGSLFLFGESNAAWRFFDGLAGVGTALVLYFFSLQLFRSRLSATFASIALLSSHGYLFEHCVRMGVQDSMLVFLVTSALYCGWRSLDWQEQEAHPQRWMCAAGVLCGLAVLTKSVNGLLPLCILGAGLVLCALFPGYFGTNPQGAKKRFMRLLGMCLLTLLLAAGYMLPHCILSEGACATFFGFEVWQRVTEGYHNVNNPWLYWELLLQQGKGIHPYLLLSSMLFALLAVFTRGDKRYLMLSLWILPPLFAFSLSASRLPWYIAPLYPAMALLASGVLSTLISLQKRSNRLLRNAARVAMLLVFAALLFQTGNTIASVVHPKRRIAADSLRESLRPHQGVLTLVRVDAPIPAFRERAYFHAMRPRSRHEVSPESSAALLHEAAQRPLLVLTSSDSLPKVLDQSIPDAYFMLPRFAERKKRMYALLYLSEKGSLPHGFTAPKRLIDFGESSAPLAYGWSHAGSFGELGIRNTTSHRAALYIEADAVFARRPTKLFFNVALEDSLRVSVNDRLLGTLSRKRAGLVTYELEIPKGFFEIGRNQISLHTEEGKGFMANWMSIQLR